MEKKGGEGGVVGSPGRGAGQEVRDAENNRLCCPVCGYDLLEVDVVDVLAKEKVRGVAGGEGGVGEGGTAPICYRCGKKWLNTLSAFQGFWAVLAGVGCGRV